MAIVGEITMSLTNNELELVLYTIDGKEHHSWTRYGTIEHDIEDLITFADGNLSSIELYDPGTDGTIVIISNEGDI